MVVTDGVEGEKCPLVHFFHWRQMSGDGGWRGCKSVGRARLASRGSLVPALHN